MNWRIGLRRIWIILSVLWIGAWGYYGYLKWPGRTWEVTDATNLKFKVRAPKDASELDVRAFAHQAEATKQRQAVCSKERKLPLCEAAFPLQMPGELTLMRVLLSAIGGPVALLLVGRAWFWVVSGFRQTTIKPSSRLAAFAKKLAAGVRRLDRSLWSNRQKL